ncbi:MAG: hypothetical protein ACHREM_15645 [Polyangiales bacterium]
MRGAPATWRAMSEERKKPKIDLKTRIPSKTVSGLAPSTLPPGAIPPPPGAVPAPPPDLLGNRRTDRPPVSIDPNDPMAAARIHSSAPPPQQQIIVVEADHEASGHVAQKKGVFYATIGGVLVIGLGIGAVVGGAMSGRTETAEAKQDAKELLTKVTASNDTLEKLLAAAKEAQAQLSNKGAFDQATIDGLKALKDAPLLSVADLQSRKFNRFGTETVGKLLTYSSKVADIDGMRASLPSALAQSGAILKAVTIPSKQTRYGVTLSKPTADPMIPMASIFDFGEAVDLKDKVDGKGWKLNVKAGAQDLWPGKGDFFDKPFAAAIETKDWLKFCPVYGQVKAAAEAKLNELVVAIEGAGDNPGTLTPGKALGDKLKSLDR